MAMDNTAAKVAKLREMAKDKNLPQDVRNTYLDEAVKLEEKAAMKSGVRMAKGGMPMVEKAGVKVPAFAADGVGKMAKGGAVVAKAPKKMMYGGDMAKTMMAKGGAAMKKPADKAADKPMAKGPALVIAVGMGKPKAEKKMMMGGAVAKDLPMRGSRTATNMAKGGSAMKKGKK
jgi:hypothetical protein